MKASQLIQGDTVIHSEGIFTVLETNLSKSPTNRFLIGIVWLCSHRSTDHISINSPWFNCDDATVSISWLLDDEEIPGQILLSRPMHLEFDHAKSSKSTQFPRVVIQRSEEAQ